MTNLPDFIPSLDERLSAEFLQHTLTLLAFPTRHDSATLRALSWKFHAPELPRDPDLPLLPAKRYPYLDRALCATVLAAILPPPPVEGFTGRRAELDQAVMALLANRPVTISGERGIGKTALLRAIAHDSRIRKHFRRVWWLDSPEAMGDAIGLALESTPILRLDPEQQPEIARDYLRSAGILVLVDNADAESARYAARFGTVAVARSSSPLAERGLGGEVVSLKGVSTDAAMTLSGVNDPNVVEALNGHPRALGFLRSLVAEDGLRPTDVVALIQSDPFADLYAASWMALPPDYQRIVRLIPESTIVRADVIDHIGDRVAAVRALQFLEKHGFIDRIGDTIQRSRPPDSQAHLVQGDETLPSISPPQRQFRQREEVPDEDGPRAQAQQLHAQGIEATDQADDEAAFNLLTEALDLRKTHDHAHAVAETLTALARLHYLRGTDGEAIRNLEAAAELLHDLRDNESLDIVRIALSRAYRRAGRLEAALGVLPDTPPPLDVAAIHTLEGNHEAALGALREQAIHDEIDGRPIRRAAAATLIRLGRYAEALESLKNDDDFHARHIRAQVYHIQDDFDKALKAYDKADELSIPDTERGIFVRNRARALASAGQLRAATTIVGAEGLWYESKLSRKVFARSAASHALYAALIQTQDNPEEAEASALKAIQTEGERITPETRAIAQHVLSALYAERGDYGAALAAAQIELEAREGGAIRDETGIGLTLHTLGDLLMALDDPERAIPNYRRALTHLDDPGLRLITLLGLRAALLAHNRVQDALDAGQQAIDLLLKRPDPDLPQLGYVMASQATTLAEHGRGTRAVQLLQDWETRLARRASEAFEHDNWGIQALWIGLVLRSVEPNQGYSAALLGDLADEALSITESHLPDSPVAWAARRDLASLQFALRQYANVLETAQPLTRVSDPAASLIVRLPAHTLTGRAFQALDRPAEALVYLSEAVTLEPDAIPHGRLMREAGAASMAAGDAAHAAELLTKSLGDLTQAEALDDHVGALVDLGYARLSLGEFSQAIETFETALGIVQELPDKALMASVLTDLANAHDTLGQYRRAASTYRRALNYHKAPDKIAATTLALARSSAALGAYPQALEAYQQAFGYPFPPDEQRRILAEQADIYATLKRPKDAIELYQAAFGIAGAPPAETAALHRNLGRLYAGLGQHDQARHNFEAALSAVEDDQSGLTLLAIAEGHRAQNQNAAALDSFARSLDYLDRSAYPVERARAFRLMGEVFLTDGRAADAISALENALDIERALSRQDGGRIVAILGYIADAHELRGELDKAAIRYHQALVYQDARHAPEKYAQTLRTLGRLYTQMRRHDDAAKALEDALGTEYGQPTPDPAAIDQTSKMLADVYRAQGRLDEAADLYRKVTPDAAPSVREGAQQALTLTLTEIARQEATLQAAEQSWQVLNRMGADLKELLFVLALQAQTYAALGRMSESETYLGRMGALMHKRRRELPLDSRDPATRALAYMLEGQGHEDARALDRAVSAYREGLTIAEQAHLPPALVWALRRKIGGG